MATAVRRRTMLIVIAVSFCIGIGVSISVYVAVRPALEAEGLCHLSCFTPTDQLLPLLDLVRECHRGLEPPFIAIQDPKATFEWFQPSYCRLDWRLFDPNELTWRFDADVYMERLKELS